jgi:hypothetical protein
LSEFSKKQLAKDKTNDKESREDFFWETDCIYFSLSLGEDILDPRSDSEMIAESRTIHSLNSTKMERSVPGI